MQWIPVSKCYPKEYQKVLISFYDKELDYGDINVGFHINKEWYLRLQERPLQLKIDAWMPLPELYRGEEE